MQGLFAFLIAVSIMRQKKVVSAEEWAFFLKPALAQEGLPPNPSGEGGWLELKVWGSVIKGEEEVPGLAALGFSPHPTPTPNPNPNPNRYPNPNPNPNIALARRCTSLFRLICPLYPASLKLDAEAPLPRLP